MKRFSCLCIGSLATIVIVAACGCGTSVDDRTKPATPPTILSTADEVAIDSSIPKPLDWESHAKVRRDNEGHILQLDFRGGSFEPSLAEPLSLLPKLAVLRFGKASGEPVDDSVFASFAAGLGGLTVLAVDFQPITGEAIQTLPESAPLVELYAAATDLDDSAEWLNGRPGLKKLRISQTDIGPQVCQRLATLDALETLDASGCPNLSDAAVAELARSSTLTDLNIYDTPITNAAARNLADMVQLRRLNLDKTSIGDEGIAKLQPLQNLEFLHLGSTQITDAAAEALSTLKGLKTLIVTRTKMTEDGVAKIAEALPECEIQLEYQP